MEFRVLGPIEVVADGQPVDLGGTRERAVLALLLLSANQVVPVDRLVDDLWGERPPETAVPTLRVFVSRLRKALRQATGADVILTQPPGYLLRIDPATLDLVRFEALAARGDTQLAAGDAPGAAATLREALGLWRGPALADVTDAPGAHAAATRLEEERLTTLEERVEADLACGQHRQLIPELEGLTAAYPLRERLWAHRMVALYRTGRQADALRAYQELRRILAEDLGLEPTAALRELESAILRQDPAVLTAAPTGSTPSATAPSGAAAAAGVVTFLFTDLVSSTQLLDRLGDDDAEELRRIYFGLLRRAVSETGGEEVKSLGDGLMATFTSPLAALRCAVAIQESMAHHNRANPDRELWVRVGLHAGEPVRDDKDFFGTAVVVASRLCDMAQGGQILASGLVTDLVGSRGGFRFTPLGPVALKGLAAPVPVVAVGWQSAEASDDEAPRPGRPSPALPMPALLTEIGRLFVGREAELKQLDELWTDAAGGERRLVLISGEPGVGKTRLAAQFTSRVQADGATVLAGRCDEDLGVPYQPFVEALRHFVEHTSLPDLRRGLGRHAGELVRIHPDLTQRLPGLNPPLQSDPETERYRLFEAVAAWLAAASEEHPIALVLDDLHWATKPTLLMLRHVMRSPERARLLIIGTFRDTELTSGHPLIETLADFRRQAGVERVALSGLAEADVAQFMAEAAGHDLDDEGLALARTIHAETQGNPFFVREVLRHLTESGGIERRDGRWGTRLPVDEIVVPEGIREVIGRRLARLSGHANQVLRVAAVMGAEFELRVVAAAGDLDQETVLSAIEEAIAARLIAEVAGAHSGYRFTHVLVRGTLYGDLSAARRVVLHRQVAEALEALHGAVDEDLPVLAHHWARAAAPVAETARAVDYATRAGDWALAQLAHDEAAAYYASALELLDAAGVEPDDPRRLNLLICRGDAQRRAGDPNHRETLLQAAHLAERGGHGDALIRAALANTRGNMYSAAFAIDAERVAVLEAAMAAVPEEELAIRAQLLANLGLELSWEWDPGRRLALSDEGLQVARRLGDQRTLAHVLLARDYTITAPENVDERLAATAEVLALSEALGDPVLASRALMLRFKAAVEVGDIDEAEGCLAKNAVLVADLGQPALAWSVMHQRAGLTLLRGDLLTAEAEILAAYDHAMTTGQPDALPFSSAQQFSLRFEQGRLAEFEEMTRLVMERTQSPGTKAIYGTLLAELDRLDDAAALFDEIAATGFVAPTNNVMWLRFAAEAAFICARLGRVDSVPKLRSMLEPYAKQIVAIAQAGAITGCVAHYLGLLATTTADWDDAEGYFAAAAGVHERTGARPWLARTRMEWAAMLLRHGHAGDAARVRNLLGESLKAAQELGLASVNRRAQSLLEQAT